MNNNNNTFLFWAVVVVIVIMVVGFITTCVISAYDQYSCEFESRHGEAYSIQHYMITFVSDLRQVSGFFRYSDFLHQ
jgi:hypothetical protein